MFLYVRDLCEKYEIENGQLCIQGTRVTCNVVPASTAQLHFYPIAMPNDT